MARDALSGSGSQCCYLLCRPGGARGPPSKHILGAVAGDWEALSLGLAGHNMVYPGARDQRKQKLSFYELTLEVSCHNSVFCWSHGPLWSVGEGTAQGHAGHPWAFLQAGRESLRLVWEEGSEAFKAMEGGDQRPPGRGAETPTRETEGD